MRISLVRVSWAYEQSTVLTVHRLDCKQLRDFSSDTPRTPVFYLANRHSSGVLSKGTLPTLSVLCAFLESRLSRLETASGVCVAVQAAPKLGEK